MSGEKKANLWPMLAMGAVIGITIGFFGDAMENWVESFSFVAEDGWISFLFPGVATGVIGGLGIASIQFIVSKLNSGTGE